MSEEQKQFKWPEKYPYEKWWSWINKKITISDIEGPAIAGPAKLEETPRPPTKTWPPPKEDLSKNVQKYVEVALNMGAVDAKAVLTKDIPQDLRAFYMGCLYPSCRWLNTNFFCPMHQRFPFENMKGFLADFQYAVVYKVLPPPMDIAPDVGPIDLDMYYTAGGGEPPDKAMLARNIARLRILSEMERKLMHLGYYDGYLMTCGVSAGPCLLTNCASKRTCSALEKGGLCPFVKTFPVGSGVVYIDYHTLGKRLGWGQLQAGGNCAFPEDVPEPNEYYNIGLLLVD